VIHPLKVVARAIDSKFRRQRSYLALKHQALHLSTIFSEACFPALRTLMKVKFETD
jgi:hypothetical protein